MKGFKGMTGMCGLEVLNNKLHELQNEKDVLLYRYGDDGIYKPEYKRIVTDIQMLNKGIEDFNLKEIHSNVEGYVKETSYDQNSGFTIIVESDNKHHIYKGIYGLYLSPADKIKIGDSLGMVKGCLYYDVTEVK